MSEQNKADEARRGLIHSVKGKAKEVFGTRTHATEKAASKAAAVKIDEAEDKLGDAADKRSEADRVAHLAAAERQQRQEEREND